MEIRGRIETNWELHLFKATAVVKVSESDFRNFRFRNNNAAKEGEKSGNGKRYCKS